MKLIHIIGRKREELKADLRAHEKFDGDAYIDIVNTAFDKLYEELAVQKELTVNMD